MSIIYCDGCDRLLDTDFVGCEENPRASGKLICGDCYDELVLDNDGSNIWNSPALGDGT